VFLLLIFLAGLAAATFAGAMYLYMAFTDRPAASSNVATRVGESEQLYNRINVLLLGVDDGDLTIKNSPKRSDTIIVASIDPDAGTINLLSIPRDTKVSIPGYKASDKITHAFAYGGPELSVKTVENLLQVPIDYYVVMDWQGFIEVIDVLGGVDIYVEHDMDYEDPYADLRIHLAKGYQHLNGRQAGEYVRFRHDELGDIGRVQRQQRFLKSLTEQMFQFGTIFKLPALISTLQDYVDTNMTPFTMLKLANSLRNFNAKSLHTEMLPGNFATIDGASYWEPDTVQTKKLVDAMFFARQTTNSGAVSLRN